MTIERIAETLKMVEAIPVSIGRMVNPSTFWVSPQPSSPNLDAPEDLCINKVLRLEAVGFHVSTNKTVYLNFTSGLEGIHGEANW